MSKMHSVSARVTQLRKEGMTWHAISLEIGVSIDTVRMSVDEEYRQARLNARNRYRRAAAEQHRYREQGKERAQQMAERASYLTAHMMVRDTRSTFARMMGDPPPGRSALDQRGRAP